MKRPYKSLVVSVQSTRKLIARYTVGKCGAGIFIALTSLFLCWHIVLIVIGASFNEKCTVKPLLPVAMVLLGGDGLLKCVSFILQLTIVVTTMRDDSYKAILFMSETSGLDNALNWMYVIILLIGDIAILTGVQSTCNSLIYYIAYFTFIVMTTVIGILLILDFCVFIYKRLHPKKNSDEKDIESAEVQTEIVQRTSI